MRKRIVTTDPRDGASPDQDWLDLDALAEVEVTSEDSAHPVEGALLPGGATGWRAGGPGRQTLRLLFAHPQPVRRIRLAFTEHSHARTQEYVLRWSADGGQSFQEIVRQQWNFSPGEATSQTEDYDVGLPAVTVLELIITPDISGGPAPASLATLRLG